MKRYLFCAMLAGTCGLFNGCASHSDERLLEVENDRIQIRQIQSRTFDTADREKTLRTVMATLQDCGFIIKNADIDPGTVVARKFIDPDEDHPNNQVELAVTVAPRGEKQVLVRVSAQYKRSAVTDPPIYQRFFATLSKAMFVEAQQVD